MWSTPPQYEAGHLVGNTSHPTYDARTDAKSAHTMTGTGCLDELRVRGLNALFGGRRVSETCVQLPEPWLRNEFISVKVVVW